MSRKVITGDKELEATLATLADKAADRVAKSALGAALTVAARAMKKAAPIGQTRTLRDSIGKRNERNKRNGIHTAKAGINVGKRKKKPDAGKVINAPHAHLVALGTQRRQRTKLGGLFAGIKNPTQEQLSTGVMPSNPFIKRAYEASRAVARTAAQRRAAKALAREAAKAAKR